MSFAQSSKIRRRKSVGIWKKKETVSVQYYACNHDFCQTYGTLILQKKISLKYCNDLFLLSKVGIVRKTNEQTNDSLNFCPI